MVSRNPLHSSMRSRENAVGKGFFCWSATVLSAPPPSNLAFHEHHDLILGTPTLQSGSYVTTNVASTIWVQDQPFGDWKSAWDWVYGIEYPVTRKRCAIDLVGQKIRMEDAAAKSSEQINELIKRDWQHLELNKSGKKNHTSSHFALRRATDGQSFMKLSISAFPIATLMTQLFQILFTKNELYWLM